MSGAFLRDLKKCDMNSDPWSEVIWEGTPCLENTCSMNSFVRLAKVTVLWVGMNIACFVRRSTTTKIVVYPDDFGSCSMKSMDIEFQGCSGIGSCLSKPYGQWGCDLENIQVIQDLQKSVTKF